MMATKTSTVEMSHVEWLENRRKGIGGSDVGTILGLNKWKSPYQLWLEKTGQVELDESNSEPAYWGNVLEEIVAKEFTERTGKKVRRRNQVFEHPLHPFLRANIDRDVVGENAILECKTANSFLAKEWDGDEVPMSYLCQIQHYMNVLNRDSAYIAVLIGGQKFIWKKVDRDQELIDMITERLVEFWEANVLQGIEPEVDGSQATTKFIKEHYAEVGEEQITLSAEFDDLVNERIQLKKDKKLIDEQINRVENTIKQKLGSNHASVGVSPNFVITLKGYESRRINKKKLEEKYPKVAIDDDIYSVSRSQRLNEKEIG